MFRVEHVSEDLSQGHGVDLFDSRPRRRMACMQSKNAMTNEKARELPPPTHRFLEASRQSSNCWLQPLRRDCSGRLVKSGGVVTGSAGRRDLQVVCVEPSALAVQHRAKGSVRGRDVWDQLKSDAIPQYLRTRTPVLGMRGGVRGGAGHLNSIILAGRVCRAPIERVGVSL